jgi:phenylacetate-CoA ligase
MWYENWLKRDQKILKIFENILSIPPFNFVKGLLCAYIAYPIAEKIEGRCVNNKLIQLKKYYKKPFNFRLKIIEDRLIHILNYAGEYVPYYRDLFTQYNFDPESIRRDIQYLNTLPFLTKDIIREQGNRMLSKSLDHTKYDVSKTGGSTGPSTLIYYSKEASDYSAATTLFAREFIGKFKRRHAIHFACQFPGEKDIFWPTREDYKCFAMNRSNIFFGSLDNENLNRVWLEINKKRPYMIHAHPSTIYALACYAEKKEFNKKIFEVFESSGELLQSYMREKIENIFECKIIDRYGLAEFGITAYQLDLNRPFMKILDSEVWPETYVNEENHSELVLTGLRNTLMPFIRYKTGDYAEVKRTSEGFYLDNVVGRIHDMVEIKGSIYPTHHIMDILDHRIQDIEEFQIDSRTSPPTLKIVSKPNIDHEAHKKKIETYWPDTFDIQYVNFTDLIRVGRHQKFRHVVHD